MNRLALTSIACRVMTVGTQLWIGISDAERIL
jgi:hypothetical protein